LVVFATGDDGWFFTSRNLLEHLAADGYTIAAFDSTVITSAAETRRARVRPDKAAESMEMLLVRVKREHRLVGVDLQKFERPEHPEIARTTSRSSDWPGRVTSASR
jgi:hypothetical protein